MTTPVLFSTHAYDYLKKKCLATDSFEEGKLETSSFPDGERYARVLTDLRGRDVVILAGTINEPDTLELFDLACTVVKLGATRLSLIVPYYGYSTMERATKSGEVVTAKTRALLLSAIPRSPGGNRLFLLDAHTEGLPHYFEGPIRPVHLYAKAVIIAAARRLGGKDFVLACTDAGRAKWVESLANDMGVLPSFVFKRRLDGETTQVLAVSAQVQGKMVIIYDDMIRTGGSLIEAAKAYRAAGASGLAAIATHGLFPGEAVSRLEKSGLFSKVVCTDSHPRAEALKGKLIDVESIAGLLVHSLKENP